MPSLRTRLRFLGRPVVVQVILAERTTSPFAENPQEPEVAMELELEKRRMQVVSLPPVH